LESISKDIQKHLIFAWRNAIEASKDLKKATSMPHTFHASPEGSFFLTLEGINAVRQIILDSKKVPDVASKFSDEYLERIIMASIAKLLSCVEEKICLEAQKQAEEILRVLASPAVEWTLIVPIVNLELEMDELQIGKVRLHRFKTDEEKELYEKITKIYRKLQQKSSVLPKDIPEGLITDLQETVKKNFIGRVCAEVTTQAVDSKRAEDIGMQLLHLVLDTLCFYRFNRNFRDVLFAKNRFDIQGNLLQDTQSLILFAETEISFPKKLTGFVAPFTITMSALRDIRTDGFDVVSDILKKDEQNWTEFEKDLITSIRFIAISAQDEQIANAFVNSVISLEALLLDEHESIIDNLAERIAFIIGKNASERNQYFDEMRRLYKIRCNVVHSGNTDIKYSDLSLLRRFINYRCVVNLLNSYRSLKISSIKDLIKWIRDQKFS